MCVWLWEGEESSEPSTRGRPVESGASVRCVREVWEPVRRAGGPDGGVV